MPKILHVVYLAAITVLVMLLFARDENPAPASWFGGEQELSLEPAAAHPSPPCPEPVTDDNVTADLERRIQTLEAENRALREGSADKVVTRSPAPSVKAIDRANLPKDTIIVDQAVIDQRLKDEPVDYEWATDTELTLRDIFYSEEALRDIQVDAVQCRTSFCVVDTTNRSDEEFPLRSFYQALDASDGVNDGAMSTATLTNGNQARIILQKRSDD